MVYHKYTTAIDQLALWTRTICFINIYCSLILCLFTKRLYSLTLLSMYYLTWKRINNTFCNSTSVILVIPVKTNLNATLKWFKRVYWLWCGQLNWLAQSPDLIGTDILEYKCTLPKLLQQSWKHKMSDGDWNLKNVLKIVFTDITCSQHVVHL